MSRKKYLVIAGVVVVVLVLGGILFYENFSRWLSPKSSVDQSSVGEATMKSDGTIVLTLRAQSGETVGDSQVFYSKDHPQYQEIMSRLGGLQPGQVKSVPSWSD